jgi:tetratricopeptide (TPR) repeat protein
VIGEIGYVESHASSSFVLMPEILVLKGKVMARVGQGPEAIPVYRKAIKLNPKYGWAYKALADLFVSLSNPAEARKVLQEGMDRAEGTNKKWFEQQIAILDEMTMKAGKAAQSAPPADEKK